MEAVINPTANVKKMSDTQYLLVLDSLRVPNAKKLCARHNIKWIPLYLGTEWQPQLDNSPICIQFSSKDEVSSLWENDHEWATSGVVFEFFKGVNFEEQMQSLQKLITLTSDDGRLFLLRFYSPQILKKIANYLGPDELKKVFNLVYLIHISPLVNEIDSPLFVNSNQVPNMDSYVLPSKLVELLSS